MLAARKVEPVLTLASGITASAAYWIESAAQAVYIAEATTITGSILSLRHTWTRARPRPAKVQLNEECP